MNIRLWIWHLDCKCVSQFLLQHLLKLAILYLVCNVNLQFKTNFVSKSVMNMHFLQLGIDYFAFFSSVIANISILMLLANF